MWLTHSHRAIPWPCCSRRVGAPCAPRAPQSRWPMRALENVNVQVDALIESGVLRRLLAFTELKFSNSMTEAWWRSLKHQWLFLHSVDSVATIRRLVAFYVHEYNTVLPHSAFRGQTPDEMYSRTGDAVPAELTSRTAAAAAHAQRPIDRRHARRVRPSTLPHDTRPVTAVLTTVLAHWRPLGAGAGPPNGRRSHARVGRPALPSGSVEHRALLAAPNGENSLTKPRMSVNIAPHRS